MKNANIHSFFVDVETSSVQVAFKTLGKLKTTLRLENDGSYNEDKSCSRLYLETTWSEEQLEEWLWRTNHIDYIGVCEATRR